MRLHWTMCPEAWPLCWVRPRISAVVESHGALGVQRSHRRRLWCRSFDCTPDLFLTLFLGHWLRGHRKPMLSNWVLVVLRRTHGSQSSFSSRTNMSMCSCMMCQTVLFRTFSNMLITYLVLHCHVIKLNWVNFQRLQLG